MTRFGSDEAARIAYSLTRGVEVLTRIAEALERLAPPTLDPPSTSVAGEHKSSAYFAYFARGTKCPTCEQSHFLGETCPYNAV